MSKAEERDSLGVLEVLIIVGFTSFWAWYFFIIIGYPEFFPVGADVGARRIAQLAAFVGVFIGSVFALHKPKNYEKSAYDTRKTVGWAVVSCVVPALVMLDAAGMQVPYPATVAIMVATGFGAGYYLTGWENLASRGRLSDPLVAFGLVMAIAFALFLVVSLFMTPLAKGVMGIVFALLGAVLFYGVSKRRNEFPASGKRKKGKQPEGDAVQEPGDVELRGTFNRKLDALLLVLNVPLGYGLAVLYLFDAMYFYIAITVALTALVVFVLLMRAFKLTLTFVNLLRIGIGVSVVALIALGMNNSLSLACGILLFATWLVLRLAHAVIVIKLTKVQRVPPVYLAVRAKQPGYLGFIAGFAIGMLTIMLTEGPPAIAMVGMSIAAILVVAALALLPFAKSYDKQLDVLPVLVDPKATSAEDIEHAKCAELARRYNLSPREEEILFFIVRGRNAKFIAEKLVISESTAKTHIHNIYKKSGIHSQQKFIDIMDELV